MDAVIDLPDEFGSLIGIDYKGHLYSLGKENAQVVLQKVKIEVTDDRSGKTVFRTKDLDDNSKNEPVQ